MTNAKPKSKTVSRGAIKVAQLEILVDELIKDAPVEARVRVFMESAGLKYTADPIARMSEVLSHLDGVRSRGRIREL